MIKVKVVPSKKTKKWVLRWQDADGTWREQTTQHSSLKRNRSLAEREAVLKEQELANNGQLPPQNWQEFRDNNYSDQIEMMDVKTRGVVNTNLDHFERICKPHDLNEIKSSDISHFITQLRKEGKKFATIETMVKRIKAACNWAHMMGYRHKPLQYSLKGKQHDSELRSRPITEEELERILEKVPEVRKHDSELWKFYIRGLWASGLRREESVKLGWDWTFDFSVNIMGDVPCFNIRGEGQKSRKDQTLPISPEFAELLRSVPAEQRRGRVFKLPKGSGQFPNPSTVGRRISSICALAGVVVTHEGDTATCQTFRKTFATRWASKLMPAELQKLMRHGSIETTLKYYSNVQVGDLWDKMSQKEKETV